jgi:hypothetical protein
MKRGWAVVGLSLQIAGSVVVVVLDWGLAKSSGKGSMGVEQALR